MIMKTRFLFLSTLLFLSIWGWRASADQLLSVSAAPAQNILTVTSLADPGDGVCDVDCTFREALEEANSDNEESTIIFNIASPYTLLPLEPLPAITAPVTIDGLTGNNADCATDSDPSDLEIQLNGLATGGGVGLELAAGSSGSVIQGLAIFGFQDFGIQIEPGSDNNLIICNHIGLGAGGTDLNDAARNARTGIYVAGDTNRIGGETAAERNVIAENEAHGIFIASGSDANIVQGNYIGTAADGITPLGNGNSGIVVNGTFNLIGGNSDQKGNIIADNGRHGIIINDDNALDNVISGNRIGLGAAGGNGEPLGNDANGIIVQQGQNTLIGDRHANTIAYNGENGIRIGQNSAGNFVAGRNSIFGNGLLGIDLVAEGEESGDVTINDNPPDSDTGGNELQNHPILQSVTADGRLVGTLPAAPGADIAIRFFANESCDDSGWGEGQRFLQRVDVTIDSGGVAFLDLTLSQPLTGGQFIAATATRLDTNNTSEFGNCVEVPADEPVTGGPLFVFLPLIER